MIDLVLLGRVAVQVAGKPVTGEAAQRRRLALLALLCDPGLRPVGRDRLMARLWPDSDTESARHLLSASLHVLRKALGAEAIVTQGEQVRLDPAHVRVDATEFETAARAGDAERAVALYTGTFGEGLIINDSIEFDHWLDARRGELARLYASSLESCAGLRAARGDHSGAIDAWRKLAALDPYSARTTLGLMRALAAAGNRAGALQAARVHARLLESEFSATPEPEVLRLADELRQESVAPETSAPAHAQVPASEARAVAPAEDAMRDPVTASPSAPAPPAAAASVRVASGPPADAPAAAGRSRARLFSRPRVASLALVATLLAGALFVVNTRERSARPLRVLAVVPLSDPGAVSAEAYLSAGVADEIRSELRRAPSLRLITSTSSFRFRDSTSIDVQRVGEALGAEALVLVRARDAGGELRVDLELVETSNGHELWGVSRRVPRAQLSALASDVAHEIGNRLGAQLQAADARTAKGGTSDAAAHDLYLQAREKWRQRTPAALQEALTLFGAAVHRDSLYALAHAGLADTYNMLGSFEYGVLSPDSAFPAARAAADRALRIVPDFPPAIAARANVLMNYDWQWEQAEQEFHRALEFDRTYAEAREWLALLLLARGRSEQAHAMLQQALVDNRNLPLVLIDVAQYHYFQSQHDSAHAYIARALEVDPSFVRAYALRALVLGANGQTAEAVQLAEQLNRQADGDPLVAALLGYLYGRAGRSDAAREQLFLLQRLGRSRYVASELVAMVHLGLGEFERALELMEQAASARSSGMIYLTLEPILAPVRNHPRFVQLLRRVHGPLAIRS